MDRETRPIPGIGRDVETRVIQRISIEEANLVADTWTHDPDIWFRDLSAELKLMINASMPPAGRYIRRDWVLAQPPFEYQAEAIDIIETVGLGNFGGPPSSIPKHRYSWSARDGLARRARAAGWGPDGSPRPEGPGATPGA